MIVSLSESHRLSANAFIFFHLNYYNTLHSNLSRKTCHTRTTKPARLFFAQGEQNISLLSYPLFIGSLVFQFQELIHYF